jgi:hypothetical protein
MMIGPTTITPIITALRCISISYFDTSIAASTGGGAASSAA